ncbi:hypothetical protein EVAR_84524_1 [Eumeta japonica]|uniref:Uncharacterized protein n=1 Tax=Eumeta variegata TaxID=151549 RepID=A0A4C1UHS0_EUMVA|nr:hypothetical protein EVAR_84524_1 [Eumeta japonica]
MSSLLLFGLGSGLSGRRWRLRLPVRILSVQVPYIEAIYKKLAKRIECFASCPLRAGVSAQVKVAHLYLNELRDLFTQFLLEKEFTFNMDTLDKLIPGNACRSI